MKHEFIFLGPPASGKGTQTKMLSSDMNLPHVDTGSMLRSAVAEGTEAGKIAKSYMDNGQLVPLEIVVRIIKDRLTKPDCDNGFILDGFPRSIEQAKELDTILDEINQNENVNLDVVNIDVDHDLLIDRIVNRRFCKNCGKIYNLKFLPPANDGICDGCGEELIQRQDDTFETAQKRLETYHNETQPIIEYYQNRNLLVNINGNRSVEEIYSDIKNLAACQR